MEIDDTIQILETNVNDIIHVTIIEDHIHDKSETVFNDQQVKSYLTDIFNDNSRRDNTYLTNKVSLYFELLKGDIKKKKRLVLNPIIKAFQNVYYTKDDEYIPDQESELMYMIEPISFDRFLMRFQILNTDPNNQYSVNAKKLYSLWKPFTTKTTIYNNIEQNIDVKDLKNRKYRTISKTSKYDGDTLEILGYYNRINTQPNVMYINWDKYKLDLQELHNGSKVLVVFNDFVFINNKLIEFIEGRYEDDVIYLSKEIMLKNELTTFLPLQSSMYFVFPVNAINFSKRTIFTTNCDITFSNNVFALTIYDELAPNTSTETLYIEYENIKKQGKMMSLNGLDTILKKYSFSLNDIHENCRYIIEYIIQSLQNNSIELYNLKKSKQISTIKPFKNVFISNIELLKEFDGNYWDAQKLRDKGLYKIFIEYDKLFQLQYVKSKNDDVLKDKLTFITELIENLENELSTIKPDSCEPLNINISKTYTSIVKLLNDNDKECYKDNNLKELIRDGDYAELSHEMFNTKLIFERKTIKGKSLWISVNNIDICKLKSINQLHQSNNSIDEFCVYDTFENTCSSIHKTKILRTLRKLNMYKTIIDNSLNINIHDIIENIKTFINIFKVLYKSNDFNIFLRNKPLYNYGLSQSFGFQDEDELEGTDIELTFEELSNNIESQDYEYTPLMLLQQNKSNKTDANISRIGIINIIKEQLDITFNDEHLEYMNEIMKKRDNTIDNYHKIIAERREQLMLKVDMKLYESDALFKKKVQEKINEKIEKEFGDIIKKVTKQYYEELIFAISLIVCVIHASYPKVDIQRLIPGAISHFASFGYPITDNTVKSLDIYIISAIKKIAIERDIRYEIFLSKTISEITKDIRINIDKILKDDYILHQSIEKKRTMMNNINKYRNKFMFHPLRTMYRPCFTFMENDKTKLEISFVKLLHESVSSTPYTRVSITNNAFLSNSCCPQKINQNIDYYNELIDNKDIKSHLNQLMISKNIISHNSFIPYEHIPHYKSQHVKRIQDNVVIKHDYNIPILYNEINVDIAYEILSDEVFESTIIPNISLTFKKIRDIVTSLIDNSEKITYESIDKIFLRGENSYIRETRNILFSFAKCKLPIILGRLKYMYPLDKIHKEDKFYSILQNVQNNNTMLEIISSVDIDKFQNEIKFYEIENTYDIVNAVKNITMILQSIFEILLHILESSIKYNINKTCTLIACNVVNYIIQSMFSFFENNVLDSQKVMKKIEELREQRKQKDIEAYDEDDEKRALQKEFKDLGVPGWDTIFSTTDENSSLEKIYSDMYGEPRNDGDISDIDGPEPYEKYEYKGEDPDDDTYDD